MDTAGVWGWQTEYRASVEISDGEGWSVELRHAGHSLKSYGYNEQPPGLGAFRNAVHQLLEDGKRNRKTTQKKKRHSPKRDEEPGPVHSHILEFRERIGEMPTSARLRLIGVIRSTIKERSQAPMQGQEGAPDAWLEIKAAAAPGLDRLQAGDEVIILTWLHRARRDVLKVYPRSRRQLGLHGVFATRSPDRPNPIGLHRVTIREIEGNRLRIGPMEAIDGTPVIDIKPVLAKRDDS